MTLDSPMNSEDSADDIIQGIDRFIQKNVGEVAQVFHEVVSDDFHIDIHHGRSRGDVRYQWLFTSGMSRIPMNAPPQCLDGQFAELVMCLPQEWPLNMDAFKDENNYWPVGLLKSLARYPHENNTWLYGGHSVPFGKAFAPNTKMSSLVLFEPRLLGREPFIRLRDKTVSLWAVCPLYEEEVAYKTSNGFEALMELLRKSEVSELLHPHRPSVLGKVM